MATMMAVTGICTARAGMRVLLLVDDLFRESVHHKSQVWCGRMTNIDSLLESKVINEFQPH